MTDEIVRPRRASGSETRRRQHSRPIRFDDEELARVEAAASLAGLTFSSFARGQILGAPAPRSVRRPPVEKELLAKVLGQLGRAGGNLNQVAHAANLGEAERGAIDAAIAEVRAAAHAAMAALGRQP